MNLDRKTVTFPDGDSGRIYFNTQGDVFPSVTTVLDRRDDPDKSRAIGYWKRKNDGKEGSPDWNHLFQYAGKRGVIVHWYILTHLVDGGMEPTDEEEDSLEWIEDRDTDYPFVYSILEDRSQTLDLPPQHQYDPDGDDPSLTDVLWDDAAWALERFFKLTGDMGLAAQNFDQTPYKTIETYVSQRVRQSNVIDAETFVVHPTLHYAGQFDFLFEQPDGTLVLGDVKTSSGVRWKHKAQLEAYAQTLDRDVDELLVVRLHPNSRESQLSWSTEWSESRTELWEEFCAINDEVKSLVHGHDLLEQSNLDATSTQSESTA